MLMFMRILFSTLALFTLILTSCESIRSNEVNVGPVVTGEIGEILVVCEQDLWDSELAPLLDTNLTQWIMPYMPDVATFTTLHKTPAHFETGVKRWRNILFINIDDQLKGKSGIIEKKKDVWAHGQLVYEVTAGDKDGLIETFKSGIQKIHDDFDDISWRRIITKNSKYNNLKAKRDIQKNFGIDLAIPSGSKLVTHRKNFYRVEFPSGSRPIDFVGGGRGTDVGAVLSGVMVYHYDYVSDEQLNFDRLLKARDTMLKYNVPHEIDGMYMGTQYNEFVYPETELVKSADGKISGREIRGMFVFKGRNFHSTGGAFWDYSFINEKTQKVVCISGYVDAPPTTSWTHYLREVQAVLRSVKIN